MRVSGLADDDVVAQRSGIDQDTVRELLGDHEAYGWVTRVGFADTTGWAMTERGRVEDSRRLDLGCPRAGTDLAQCQRRLTANECQPRLAP